MEIRINERITVAQCKVVLRVLAMISRLFTGAAFSPSAVGLGANGPLWIDDSS